MKCHAGCPTEKVVQAVGLKMRDLMAGESFRRHAGFPKTCKPRSEPQTTRPNTTPAFAAVHDAVRAFQRTHGTLTNKWPYYNADGELVGIVLRCDTPSGKRILPVARGSDGRWRFEAMPKPRPLYNLLEILSADAAVPIVVVEGEKAADAARKCGLVGTTSAGGAQAAKLTDWLPMRGRHVVIIPDNDEAGEKYAADVRQQLRGVGAASIKILRLRDYTRELPAGGDLADVVEHEQWYRLGLGDAATLDDCGRYLLSLAEQLPHEQFPQASQQGKAAVGAQTLEKHSSAISNDGTKKGCGKWMAI
jgi:5S rRNA maturation endonuclease (ribonuclease M5)